MTIPKSDNFQSSLPFYSALSAKRGEMADDVNRYKSNPGCSGSPSFDYLVIPTALHCRLRMSREVVRYLQLYNLFYRHERDARKVLYSFLNNDKL